MKRKIIVLSAAMIFFAFCDLQVTISQTMDIRDKNTTIQSISVTIGGNFIVNGTFPASPTERVDQFITRICLEIAKSQNTKLFDVIEVLKSYPNRGITLVRSNGEKINVDLAKYRLTGNFQFNPYVRNEDIIIFPQKDKNDIIAVTGAVNKQIEFEFCEGDKIEDALLFAQGLNPLYEKVTHIEIYRLTYEGKFDTVLTLPLELSYPLKRGDRIKFVSNEPRRRNYRAYVDGEVYQPGWVYLPEDGLPLKKVLSQVGGVRDVADLSRTEIIRGGGVHQSVYYGQEFEKLLMQRMSVIKDVDSVTFLIDNTLRIQRGALAKSLTELQTSNEQTQEIIIRDGDYIYIPRKIDYVYVFGQVNNFGYIPYIAGKDYRYYIVQAGGLGETAKNEVYVIKNRSRAWYLATEKHVEIEPGDFIWVPKKPIQDFDYYLQRIGYIGSIVTGLITVIVLIIQVTKN
ncbi:MAG: capsule biosynthesis GfcC family protein [Bacteroidetes bacterium]|nr:capsule biosynthesis GfcC family protein [Bacteroidota bacterium]